jgi:hypothetical protein
MLMTVPLQTCAHNVILPAWARTSMDRMEPASIASLSSVSENLLKILGPGATKLRLLRIRPADQFPPDLGLFLGYV